MKKKINIFSLSLLCLSFSHRRFVFHRRRPVLATGLHPLSPLPSSPCHRTSAPPPLQHNTPSAPPLSSPSHNPQLFLFTTLKSHHCNAHFELFKLFNYLNYLRSLDIFTYILRDVEIKIYMIFMCFT